MSRTRYDFTAAADFLNNDVPLMDLYDDVVIAMNNLGEKNHLTRKDIINTWGVLLTCADFLDTIVVKRIKKKGGRK